MSQIEAQQLVRQIIREGFFVRTDHFRNDRSSRRSASDQDVKYILETGTVIEKPEWNEKNQNWTCKVEGMDLENERLRVVTAIVEPDWTVVIITVTG